MPRTTLFLFPLAVAGTLSVAAQAPSGPAPSSPPRLIEHVQIDEAPFDLVEMNFLVLDRTGRPVTGLGKDDFVLEVDRRETALESLFEERSRVDRRVSVVFLIDTSGSMRKLERDRFLAAARALLARLRPSDEMMVASFATDCRLLTDFTSDPATLSDAFESSPRPDGGTGLSEALEEALSRLSKRTGRRVVILYSDGGAEIAAGSLTASPDTLDVLDETVRQPIPVYWVVPHFQGIPAVERNPELRRLVMDSGGRWILETQGIEKALIEVGEDVASQYFASFFVDRAKHPRASYRVELRPRTKGLTVRSPRVVPGSREPVRRLGEMLGSDRREVRLAASSQLARYGCERACGPLLGAHGIERDPDVRDAMTGALLSLLREEWESAATGSASEAESRRRRVLRRLRRMDDPRAEELARTLPGSIPSPGGARIE